jgi:hypothetical protein
MDATDHRRLACLPEIADETAGSPPPQPMSSTRTGWRRPEVAEYEIGGLVAGRPASREVGYGVLPGGTPRGFPVQHSGNWGVVSRRPVRPAVARMVMASSIPRAVVAMSGIV